MKAMFSGTGIRTPIKALRVPYASPYTIPDLFAVMIDKEASHKDRKARGSLERLCDSWRTVVQVVLPAADGGKSTVLYASLLGGADTHTKAAAYR